MKEFVGLRPKICSYLTDNTDKSKKAKDINYSVIRGKLKFESYKNCFESSQLQNKTIHLNNKIDLNVLQRITKNL